MVRPKNTVTLTKSDRTGKYFDIWEDSPKGRSRWGRRATTTILKALKYYEKYVKSKDLNKKTNF